MSETKAGQSGTAAPATNGVAPWLDEYNDLIPEINLDELITEDGKPVDNLYVEKLYKLLTDPLYASWRPPGEPKACGGGVTSKALKAWPHLLEAVGRNIDELDMYSPSGKHLHLKLDEPFAVYSRIAFDTFLLERARVAGAQVFAEKISARGFKRVEGKMDTVLPEGSLDPVASTTPRGLPARGPRSARGSDTSFLLRSWSQ